MQGCDSTEGACTEAASAGRVYRNFQSLDSPISCRKNRGFRGRIWCNRCGCDWRMGGRTGNRERPTGCGSPARASSSAELKRDLAWSRVERVPLEAPALPALRAVAALAGFAAALRGLVVLAAVSAMISLSSYPTPGPDRRSRAGPSSARRTNAACTARFRRIGGPGHLEMGVSCPNTTPANPERPHDCYHLYPRT